MNDVIFFIGLGAAITGYLMLVEAFCNRFVRFHGEVVLGPAWDRRDPDSSKNYGIHGVDLTFYLKGPRGTVQFKVFTNWQLPHVQEEMDDPTRRIGGPFPYMFHKPIPADLGYHSPIPLYEDQEPMDDACPHVHGGVCSGLMAENCFQILLEKGSDGVWARLKAYYKDTFEEMSWWDYWSRWAYLRYLRWTEGRERVKSHREQMTELENLNEELQRAIEKRDREDNNERS